MPRTKRRVKRYTTNDAMRQFLNDFNKLMEIKMKNIDNDYKSMMEKFDVMVDSAIASYPPQIQNMTLAELLYVEEEEIMDQDDDHQTAEVEQMEQEEPQEQDEADDEADEQMEEDNRYCTMPLAPLSLNFKKKIVPVEVHPAPKSHKNSMMKSISSTSTDYGYSSQLSTASSNHYSTKKARKLHKKKEHTGFLTPSHPRTKNTFVITPKIKLNSAIKVLRKAKDGEMVFSTQGSPLLVSTTVGDRTANVNVPLVNGNVVSLLPYHDGSLSEDLNLDEETKNQLKILKSHLEKVLK